MKLDTNIPQGILDVVEVIKLAGGKPYLVGGGVINLIREEEVKDWDIEVFHLSYNDLIAAASKVTSKVDLIGQKFGVVKVRHEDLDIELSVPRKDNTTGPSHKDFDVTFVPDMSIKEAARRRDFTINSMYYDFDTNEIIDHYNGLSHLSQGLVHNVDSDTFCDDPLRAFRAVQIVARKGRCWSWGLMMKIAWMTPDLNSLSSDAILGEMNKLLMLAETPSIGLKQFGCDLINLFPELSALQDCKQSPVYHPEGDVWEHTMLVVDEAAKYRDEIPEDWRLAFMWGMLLHDIGKPVATKWDEENERWTSIKHDKLGEPIARQFMSRLTTSEDLIDKVCAIVSIHMRPRLLLKATPKRVAWRRLQNICPLNVLAYVSMADTDGRGDPLERCGKEEPSFVKTMQVYEELGSPTAEIKPVLMGRHLIEKGLKPGPEFGALLKKAYEYQLETGCEDIDKLFEIGKELE